MEAGRSDDHRLDALTSLARLGICRHVQARRRVVADQYHGELRGCAEFREQFARRDAQSIAQLPSMQRAVDDLGARRRDGAWDLFPSALIHSPLGGIAPAQNSL